MARRPTKSIARPSTSSTSAQELNNHERGRAPRDPLAFDPNLLLSKLGTAKTVHQYRDKRAVFSQGDPADAVFYIQKGRVKLSVVSKRGKEAVIAVLQQGDFFGEGCLAAQPLRISSAAAMQNVTITRLEKKTIALAASGAGIRGDVYRLPALPQHSHRRRPKRLARLLLLLAHYGKDSKPETVLPRMSQETLAEMIGTTRSRVSHFMNRFRKMGFIDYNGALHVHSALLTVVLRD
jgi:CRP-like cAMP-binding protein